MQNLPENNPLQRLRELESEVAALRAAGENVDALLAKRAQTLEHICIRVEYIKWENLA